MASRLSVSRSAPSGPSTRSIQASGSRSERSPRLPFAIGIRDRETAKVGARRSGL